MQRILALALLAIVAGTAVPAVEAKVDCSPSIGEYATLANFTILAELLDATGLYGALNNTPFTAFAPTDDTFIFALTTLDIAPEQLTSEAFLPTLAAVLSYHVSSDKYSVANLSSKASTTVSTLAGAPLTVNYTSTGKPSPLVVLAAESSASIDIPNSIAIPECGVYVYPINSVMLPPGGTEALLALTGAAAPTPAAAPAAAISG